LDRDELESENWMTDRWLHDDCRMGRHGMGRSYRALLALIRGLRRGRLSRTLWVEVHLTLSRRFAKLLAEIGLQNKGRGNGPGIDESSPPHKIQGLSRIEKSRYGFPELAFLAGTTIVRNEERLG